VLLFLTRIFISSQQKLAACYFHSYRLKKKGVNISTADFADANDENGNIPSPRPLIFLSGGAVYYCGRWFTRSVCASNKTVHLLLSPLSETIFTPAVCRVFTAREYFPYFALCSPRVLFMYIYFSGLRDARHFLRRHKC
jgi:hypothetical protein